MESAALLVVDVQKGLFGKKSRVYNEDILLQNINYLIDKARARNMPVVFVRHSNKGFLVENSDNWQVHPSLKFTSYDLFLNKEHSGMFEEKKIVAEMKKLSVNTLIVTGMVTHGCVKAACMGAKDAGYEVILVEDAHSSFNDNAKRLIDEWNEKLQIEGIRVVAAKKVFE